MRGPGGEQKLGQRVSGQRLGQGGGLGVAGQQRQHEGVLAQLGVRGVARQRVRHAGGGKRRIALVRGELRHQEIRRPRRLRGRHEGGGKQQGGA